ncbi:hypothetical protein Hdeb2414_s0017g00504551 [Helianthus debilis subsp. tardiflorus]
MTITAVTEEHWISCRVYLNKRGCDYFALAARLRDLYKLEKLKNKEAAKKKNHKAATVKDIVKSEKKQVDGAHQEKSKQDESTELSQIGEVKESRASTNETSSSEQECSKCDKFRADNVKLLKDVESLTLENKILKENEKEFQNQINILENEKFVLNNNDFENQKAINSRREKITQLESAENKIDDLEKTLKSFVTSSILLDHICPKPINEILISDNVTNYDKVIIEDCDDKTDDEDDKKKIFLKLKEKFEETVLQSTERGECSKQKPFKKSVEQKKC